MKTTIKWASAFVVVVMLLISCGKGEQSKVDEDSLAQDSVPPSGENESQSDIVPPLQVDSIKDTTNRKP